MNSLKIFYARKCSVFTTGTYRFSKEIIVRCLKGINCNECNKKFHCMSLKIQQKKTIICLK